MDTYLSPSEETINELRGIDNDDEGEGEGHSKSCIGMTCDGGKGGGREELCLF